MSDLSGFTDEEIIEEIYSVPYWRQQIPISDEIRTPGRSTADKWERFDLADDLNGVRLLDIGSWDGLHAFIAEDRGANAIAMDVYSTKGDYEGWWDEVRKGGADAGIKTVKQLRNSNIQIWDRSVYTLDSADDGLFDIVLFPAVLYHLAKPMDALEAIEDVTDGSVLVETMVQPDGQNASLDDSPTPPFWVPDRSTLSKMLRASEFSNVRFLKDGFQPFRDTFAVVEPDTSFSRQSETTKLTEWHEARMLKNGDTLPTDHYSGKYYIELRNTPSPEQGWVPQTAVHTGYRAVAKTRGLRGIGKRILWNQLHSDLFGRRAQRIAGINDWVVVKADS
jgi:hypothetical protein